METARNSIVRLGTDTLMVDVDPVAGGRVAQIWATGTPLLIGRHDADATDISWGAFPMVPWAGRIRGGRFTFDGNTVQLVQNAGEHALHGVGYVHEWSVERTTDISVELTMALPTDATWPFGGAANQHIRVQGSTVTSVLSVTAHDQPFPVSLGWHPWFRKPTRLSFEPTAMYRRDEHHIAVDDLVAVPPGPWDDCFINRAPVALTIDGIEVTLRSACTHWVVYDMPAHATCVEPQTGPPDAFNIAPIVVEPGATLTASYQLSTSKS